MSPIVDLVFYSKTSAKSVGESGVTVITAPLPANDCSELPYSFLAITLTNTDAPQSKLNGSALSADTGTVHVVSKELVMSQFVVSLLYSPSL